MRTRPELVPFGHRVGALLGARMMFAGLVVAAVTFAGGAVSASEIDLVALSLSYVLVTGGFEGLRRLTGRRGLELISTMLLVDGCYLVAVVASTGGTDSPLLFLVHLHVVASTLLASFRTGAAVAVWHALLLVTTEHFAAAAGSAAPAGELALVIVSYGVVGVATGAFASLNERVLRSNREAATTLLELAAALEECRSVADVTAVGAAHLRKRAEPGRAAVLVRGDDGWIGSVADGRVTAPVRLPCTAPAIGDGSRRPSLHAALDTAVWPELDAVLPGAANVVVVPLVADGRDVGVSALEYGGGRRLLPVEELTHIEETAARVALSVRAVQLLDEVERLATSDPLTGLPNRRLFDEALQREVGRAARYGTPLGLAMLDVDRFKDVNDVHGHLVGDEVLRQLADALRAATRPESLVARYGGEEFVVLLPDADRHDAIVAGERLRAAATQVRVVPVTVSVGVAVLADGEDPEALVAGADTALYEAKAAGRNRTVCRRLGEALSNGAAAP